MDTGCPKIALRWTLGTKLRLSAERLRTGERHIAWSRSVHIIHDVSDSEPEPLVQMNFAPDLPHFGKHFDHHAPSGVRTFRIDVQDLTHDGLVLIGGTIIRGSENFQTGIVRDCTGQQISMIVTESEYMRLSNGPLP